jgi:hypothetical protein
MSNQPERVSVRFAAKPWADVQRLIRKDNVVKPLDVFLVREQHTDAGAVVD